MSLVTPVRSIELPAHGEVASETADGRVTVVGTPWRELVFLELTTDDGLTGIGEVRMVDKTDTLVA